MSTSSDTSAHAQRYETIANTVASLIRFAAALIDLLHRGITADRSDAIPLQHTLELKPGNGLSQ